MKISQLTRRDIIDAIAVKQINWSGRMEEQEFLSSYIIYLVYHQPMVGSETQLVISGNIDLITLTGKMIGFFYDKRFNLLTGDDDSFLTFLCETIHPVVRPDPSEAEWISQLYNQYLQNDGFQIVEKTRFSGKPVFIGRYVGTGLTPAITAARQTLGGTDPGYVAQQITRMETAVANDPMLAIGTAKELVETCRKTILQARSIRFSTSADLPDLMKLTIKELELTPGNIPETAKGSDTIKRLLNNLATIVQGVAELRNFYGTGHGKVAGYRGLGSRDAKLAVGAASTLAVFLAETHNEKRHKS